MGNNRGARTLREDQKPASRKHLSFSSSRSPRNHLARVGCSFASTNAILLLCAVLLLVSVPCALADQIEIWVMPPTQTTPAGGGTWGLNPGQCSSSHPCNHFIPAMTVPATTDLIINIMAGTYGVGTPLSIDLPISSSVTIKTYESATNASNIFIDTAFIRVSAPTATFAPGARYPFASMNSVKAVRCNLNFLNLALVSASGTTTLINTDTLLSDILDTEFTNVDCITSPLTRCLTDDTTPNSTLLTYREIDVIGGKWQCVSDIPTASCGGGVGLPAEGKVGHFAPLTLNIADVLFVGKFDGIAVAGTGKYLPVRYNLKNLVATFKASLAPILILRTDSTYQSPSGSNSSISIQNCAFSVDENIQKRLFSYAPDTLQKVSITSCTFQRIAVGTLYAYMDIPLNFNVGPSTLEIENSTFADCKVFVLAHTTFDCVRSEFTTNSALLSPQLYFSTVALWGAIGQISECRFIDSPSGIPAAVLNRAPNLFLVGGGLGPFTEDLYPRYSLVQVDRMGFERGSWVSGVLQIEKAMEFWHFATMADDSDFSVFRDHRPEDGLNVTSVRPYTIKPIIHQMPPFAASSIAATPIQDFWSVTSKLVSINVCVLGLPRLRYVIDDIENDIGANFTSLVVPPFDRKPIFSFSSNNLPAFAPNPTKSYPLLFSSKSLSLYDDPVDSKPQWDTILTETDAAFRFSLVQPDNFTILYRVVDTTVSGCSSPKPQPQDLFVCIGTVWTLVNPAGGDPSTPVPPIVLGAPVVVQGNFTPSELTFIGLSATINVDGCVSLPEKVTITLTPGEIEELQKNKEKYATLIASRCATNGRVNININSNKKIRKCERVTGTLESNGNTLRAVFKLNSSKCNTWWIILVAVVGAVVLIAIILALVFTLVPAARNCIRPYHKRNKAKTDANVT